MVSSGNTLLLKPIPVKARDKKGTKINKEVFEYNSLETFRRGHNEVR